MYISVEKITKVLILTIFLFFIYGDGNLLAVNNTKPWWTLFTYELAHVEHYHLLGNLLLLWLMRKLAGDNLSNLEYILVFLICTCIPVLPYWFLPLGTVKGCSAGVLGLMSYIAILDPTKIKFSFIKIELLTIVSLIGIISIYGLLDTASHVANLVHLIAIFLGILLGIKRLFGEFIANVVLHYRI